MHLWQGLFTVPRFDYTTMNENLAGLDWNCLPSA